MSYKRGFRYPKKYSIGLERLFLVRLYSNLIEVFETISFTKSLR